MKNYRPNSPVPHNTSFSYSPVQAFGLDELFEANWTGVQDTVKLAVKAIVESLKIQGQSIRQIEKNLDCKVSSAEFYTNLAQKTDFTEFTQSSANLKTQIDGKISMFDLESLVFKPLNEINRTLLSKVSFEQIMPIIDKRENKEVRATIQDLSQKMESVMKTSSKFVSENLQFLGEQRDIKKKIEIFQDVVESFEKNIHKTKKEMTDLIDLRISQKSKFTGTENRSELNITRKNVDTDRSQENVFNNFISKNQNFKLTDIKTDIETLFSELKYKASSKDIDNAINPIKKKLETVDKELLLKSSIKDICTLLDMKANIEDLNIALTDIHKELDQKLFVDNFSSFTSEQTAINSSLLTMNCTGRWIWRGKNLVNSNIIPWEIQILNASPDVFSWEACCPFITVIAPGLYEISLGFYSKKKISGHILVNGSSILSVEPKEKSKATESITGLTYIDFLALPQRSKISISLTGDTQNSEGFLSLKKIL